MYRPLPKELTIKTSPIEGLGLFTNEDIKANNFIGLTHIRHEKFENKVLSFDLSNTVLLMMSSGKFGGFNFDKLKNL